MVQAKGLGLHARTPVANLTQWVSKNRGVVRLVAQSSARFLAESDPRIVVWTYNDTWSLGDVGRPTALARTLDFLRSLWVICRSHRRIFWAYHLSGVSRCLLDCICGGGSSGMAK